MKASATLAPELHLRNSLIVSVRAVTCEDEASIFEFLAGLSVASRRLRFFSAAINLRAEAHRGAAGDDVDHHGVVAIAPSRGVVGHANYVRLADSERAEVAVEVEMEKNVRLPSRVEAQSWVESGEMAMERISEVNGSGSDVGVRANMDQRRIV